MDKKRYQVTLTVEGLHSQGGDPDLDAFVLSVRNFRDTLRAVERDLTREKPTLELRVVKLSHSSPAMVTVEAFARPGTPDIRDQWISRVNETMRSVINLTDVDILPIPVLKKMRDLSRDIGRKLAALRIASGDDVISFNLNTYQATNKVIEDYREYDTAATGTLDTIDFHAGVNRFVIYPTHKRPSSISCSFAPELADAAQSAVRKRVTIIGRGRFRRGAFAPVLVFAHKLEVLPNDVDLPSLSDLRGTEPDITGDLVSEEFVRERRDAWS